MNEQLGQNIILFVFSIWSLLWKGLALWRATKHNQKNWFIALLILNTVGILDIVYLFRFSKKRMTLEELKGIIKEAFTTKTVSK